MLQRDRVGMKGPFGKQVESLPILRPIDQWRRHSAVLRTTGTTTGTHPSGRPAFGGIYIYISPYPRRQPFTVRGNIVKEDSSDPE